MTESGQHATARWACEVLACPVAGEQGALRPQDGVGWACEASAMSYPVLGGVPILMPEPARWVAEHRDGILAALARHGLADLPTVGALEALSEPWQEDPPEAFVDDWTRRERAGQADFEPPLAGPARDAMAGLIEATRTDGVLPTMVQAAAIHQPGLVVELGPGAGLLSAELATRCHRLLLLDRSVPSLLLARQRARAAGSAEVEAAVIDADELCLRPGSADAVISANLVDLISAPERLVDVAARALAPGGLLLVSTPRPALYKDSSDEGLLAELVEQAGLRITALRDGLPWLRQHSPRESQVFLCQLVAATKP